LLGSAVTFGTVEEPLAAAALTTKLKVLEAVEEAESVTLITTVSVPAVVGVPDKTPALLILQLPVSGETELIDHV
jgi:hypothetical protein